MKKQKTNPEYLMRFLVTLHEPDGKSREYLCKERNRNAMIVEGEIIEPVDKADTFHFKKSGDALSIGERHCYFIKENT